MVSHLDALRELQQLAVNGYVEDESVTTFDAAPPINGRIPQQPWPEPMAEEAYHGITGEIVRELEPHTESDPVAILSTFLVYAGNCIDREPHAVAEADRHGTNFFAVLVGETAKGRKGSSGGHIRELFNRVDSAWESSRVMGGMTSGEGLVWNVRDAIEKEEAIKDDKNKHTGHFEKKLVDPGIQDKRLLAYEPEFASVLKVMSRDTNTLSAQVRQAWDAVRLSTMVKNNPAVATKPHVSILGHITKSELLRHMNDTEAANGFANRFLWFLVKRSKVLPDGGGTPNYQRLVPMLHDAIEKARSVGRLERDEETRKAWAQIYPNLSDGKPGLFGAVIGRAEAQVLRLSVLYAALDGDTAIRMPHLMAALAVWEYAEQSARYVFGDATGDPIADRVMENLRMFGRMSRTEINNMFQRNVSAARISQALNLLYTTGKARFEKEESDGVRPVEVWMPV